MDFVYRGVSYTTFLPEIFRTGEDTFMKKYRGIVWRINRTQEPTRPLSEVQLKYRGTAYAVSIAV